MKKLLMAAVAASAIAATPAMAATSATYSVSGSVAGACSISATGSVDFGPLTDGAGAYNNSGTSSEDTDDSAYCNQAATTVTITHTNLANTASAPTGFTNTVTFDPVVSTQSVTLTGDKAGGTLIGAFDVFKVKATATAPSAKLVAGSYSGSITITLAPTT